LPIKSELDNITTFDNIDSVRQIKYYQTPNGTQPAQEWLGDLDRVTQAKVKAYIDRVAMGGGRKNIKPVGSGVHEIKIDYGPGFRVYFGEVGTTIILLLLGGDKSTQSRDIRQAILYWSEYAQK
jgi:putative addiction module killer protein